MYSHLLVTLDGSPRAETVIPHAIDIARTMHAEVTLLRIVDAATGEWGERGSMGRSHVETSAKSLYLEQAALYLERVADQLRGSGIEAHTIVAQGQPAKQIAATAKKIEADVIAMATHSRHGINKLVFGSVAEAVMHETNLPILLVRG
jgi:nucleotide-binding universal stress UspA family protein